MKNKKIVLLFLLVFCPNIFCMDFVRQALESNKRGELKQQVNAARVELFFYEVEEDLKKEEKLDKINRAIYIIEEGLECKKYWQPGEVEALFNSLFSAKFPNESFKDNLKRFKRSNLKPRKQCSSEDFESDKESEDYEDN